MKRNRVWRWVLPLGIVLWTALIWSQSLLSAERSSLESGWVTRWLMGLMGWETKPVWLTYVVRKTAHFAEFALLSAFCTWCVRSYTKTKPFFLIPVPLCVGVAFLDEFLQTLSDGRNCQLMDVLIDSLGSCAGFIFAICTLLIASAWIKKRRINRERFE